ncbi:PH domain-containing protein [Streptomyces sp. NPDC058867]|uniref:PH domain-containing protein n=1 Tax=unclassified Streptomyces TaxID=2593676 RepID=UPI00368A4B46
MTTPEHSSSAPRPPAPTSRDRVYRSPMGIVGGVLLIGTVLWLGIDALTQGSGRAPWLALAAMILLVPVVAAFTLRPAVHANEERLRIRNPLRVVVLPWARVASLRSGYSNEAVTESGAKYQLWAIPVSLRARKKAARRAARAESERKRGSRGEGGRGGGLGFGFGGGLTGGGFGGGAAAEADGPIRAETDKVMDELRELWETSQKNGIPSGSEPGEVSVRWAYEVIAPALAGAVLLVVLLAVG